MIIKPRILSILIIFSFVLLVITNGEATELNILGFAFWFSLTVFAFCCIHLAKNEEYYKKFLDDDL